MKSKILKCLQVQSRPGCTSTALLILRLIVGCAFIIHGWGKIQTPFSWMPPGAPVPGFFQFLAAISEFGGGIAYVIGLLTPLAALGIGFTMSVAVCTHMLMLKDPFVNTTGGSSYELAATYLAIAILFFIMGPGKFSLDAKAFGQKQ
jgi:putative oxidoreductase